MINNLQRLPGKKLAIAFSGLTLKASEEDLTVVGRIAMEMKIAKRLSSGV